RRAALQLQGRQARGGRRRPHPPGLALEYTPPARRDPWAKCSSSSRDRRSARAPVPPTVPPPPVAPRPERARGGRLRGGGRVLLDVLSLPRRCGVPLGGGGGRRQPALAAPLAPRRGHRAHVGAEGHAPVEEARVLREAPQGPAAPGGARAVSRLLRSDPRAAAEGRRRSRERALERLIERYTRGAIFSNERVLARLFGLRAEEVTRVVGRLVTTGALRADCIVDGWPGRWLVHA